MNKKILIGSIFAALLMASMPFVSAFQARPAPATSEVIREEPVNEKEDVIVEEDINIKNLLFQTIVDIHNHLEIQESYKNFESKAMIYVSYEPVKNIFSMYDTDPETFFSDIKNNFLSLTVEDLESLYQEGLNNQLDNDVVNNFVNSFYITNKQLREKINNIIMNDATIKGNLEILKQMNGDCDCNSEAEPSSWYPIITCSILFAIMMGYAALASIPGTFLLILGALLSPLLPIIAEVFIAIATLILAPSVIMHEVGVDFGCWPEPDYP